MTATPPTAAPVEYADILLPNGGIVLGALSRTTPKPGERRRVYALEHVAADRVRCGCPGYLWHGDCAHAANAPAEGRIA